MIFYERFCKAFRYKKQLFLKILVEFFLNKLEHCQDSHKHYKIQCLSHISLSFSTFVVIFEPDSIYRANKVLYVIVKLIVCKLF